MLSLPLLIIYYIIIYVAYAAFAYADAFCCLRLLFIFRHAIVSLMLSFLYFSPRLRLATAAFSFSFYAFVARLCRHGCYRYASRLIILA